MTILVDDALLRGALVPSEVSAAFLDDALRRSALDAVDQLEGVTAETSSDRENAGPETGETELKLQQARSFLRRMRFRPFSTAQSRVRQRNANALMAISDWHRTRDHGIRHGPLDIPGSYTDPASSARDVIPYTAGQRAITLAEVKMMVAGEWLALTEVSQRLSADHLVLELHQDEDGSAQSRESLPAISRCSASPVSWARRIPRPALAAGRAAGLPCRAASRPANQRPRVPSASGSGCRRGRNVPGGPRPVGKHRYDSGGNRGAHRDHGDLPARHAGRNGGVAGSRDWRHEPES